MRTMLELFKEYFETYFETYRLVVWNIFIFPYIGNNYPIWPIFFRGVQTTNQHMLEELDPDSQVSLDSPPFLGAAPFHPACVTGWTRRLSCAKNSGLLLYPPLWQSYWAAPAVGKIDTVRLTATFFWPKHGKKIWMYRYSYHAGKKATLAYLECHNAARSLEHVACA